MHLLFGNYGIQLQDGPACHHPSLPGQHLQLGQQQPPHSQGIKTIFSL